MSACLDPRLKHLPRVPYDDKTTAYARLETYCSSVVRERTKGKVTAQTKFRDLHWMPRSGVGCVMGRSRGAIPKRNSFADFMYDATIHDPAWFREVR